ncbi:ribonuclease H-like domain-containing protein [Lentinula raphanica]|nr:ribonuclease H-like domain-containing protein [Lentinula raphanica]
MSSDQLPPNITQKLHWLRLLLDSLPKALPSPQRGELPKHPFGTFRPDAAFLERTEDEVGAINESFKAIFGWRTRTTGDGIIDIKEQGKNSIGAVADLLEGYLKKYKDSSGAPNAILVKWVEDISKGCEKVIKQHGESVPDFPISPPLNSKRSLDTDTQEEDTDPMAKRRKLGNQFAKLHLKKAAAVGSKSGPGRTETDVIRRLAVKYVNEKGEPFYGCIAENCPWLKSENAARDRILRHCTSPCKHLSEEDRRFAFTHSAKSSLGQHMDTQLSTQSTSPTSAEVAGNKPTLKAKSITVDFTEAGKEEWQKRLDFSVMKLICVQGIAPNVLDSNEWNKLISVATKNRLKATHSDIFEERHIPNEASHIRQLTIELLRKEHNLTLTFDGSDTRGGDSIYTAHATTADRKTYFLNYYEGTDEHHTGEWVEEFILNSMDLVGRQHFGAVCSDDTGNTRKGRYNTKNQVTSILNLRDACHFIHNMSKDITNLPEFVEMKKTLCNTIKLFSQSKYSARLLKKERLEDNIMQGLVKIGKTRFATHYSASAALDKCFDYIQQLIYDKKSCSKGLSLYTLTVKSTKLTRSLKNKDITKTFTGQRSSLKFKLVLAQYNKIMEPLAHSIWSLEAVHMNPADVYLFWLAMGTELQSLFDKDEDDTGIEPQLARKMTCTSQHFTWILKSGTISSSSLTVVLPAPSSGLKDDAPEADTTPSPSAYRRVKRALKGILRGEVDMYRSYGDSSSIAALVKARGSVQALVSKFVPQLVAYSRREYPFTDMVSKSTLQWWQDLLLHPKGCVLAFCAVKLYSTLANSMPDERWGSHKTRINTPSRNKQSASTIARIIEVGEWYGTHQKPEKPRKKPQVGFSTISENQSKTQATDCTPSDGETELQEALESQVEVEGKDQDEDEPGEGFDAGIVESESIELDEDINLGSKILRRVIPKEASDGPGVILQAFAPPETVEDDVATVEHHDTNGIDWDNI